MYKYLWVVIAFCLLGVGAARAESDFYNVEVYVDVTSGSSAEARERAMSEANRSALNNVVKKITTAAGAAKFAALSNEQLVNFIKEVSVVSEKVSDVRYIATLDITLNEQLIKDYMKEQEIPFMVEASTKVTVIPVFREYKSERPLLWEAANVWKQAWEKHPPQGGLIQFVVLPASGAFYEAVDADKALALDGGALEKAARLSGSSDVYVADAYYNGLEGLAVEISSLNSDKAVKTLQIPGEKGPELLAKAVEEVSAQIIREIKRRNIKESQQQSEMVVLYTYPRVRNWVEIEKQLAKIPYVNNLALDAVGSGKVQFRIRFSGTTDKLMQALRNNGFSLTNQGDFYLLDKF